MIHVLSDKIPRLSVIPPSAIPATITASVIVVMPTIVSPLSSILPNIPAFAGDGSAVSSYFADPGGNHFFDGPNPRTQTW